MKTQHFDSHFRHFWLFFLFWPISPFLWSTTWYLFIWTHTYYIYYMCAHLGEKGQSIRIFPALKSALSNLIFFLKFLKNCFKIWMKRWKCVKKPKILMEIIKNPQKALRSEKIISPDKKRTRATRTTIPS